MTRRWGVVSDLLREGWMGISLGPDSWIVSYSASVTFTSKPVQRGTSMSREKVGSEGAPMAAEGI